MQQERVIQKVAGWHKNKRHKFKFRLKTIRRRKRDDRLLLDIPTTDPGSDLLFSTDDEYIDANGAFTSYNTMSSHVKRHLVKNELQEDIGDCLQNMPPELIITSPTNKAAERYEHKSQVTNGLPVINGHMTKRTRSLHIQNTPSLSPNRAVETKIKDPNVFYRTLPKKKILSKEDLDIKLSLKKKIWTGIQLDDRSKSLGWVAPQGLKSKKLIRDQNYSIDINSNIRKLENEAFVTACSRKLMEWQMMATNRDVCPFNLKPKVPLKIIVPDTNHDPAIYILKHVANVKTTSQNKFVTKPKNEISETNPERVISSGKNLTKLSKSKLRNSMSTAHRTANKIELNQRKLHIRSNKFKTGRLVVTAVHTGTMGSGTGAIKINKKIKSIHHKLPNINTNAINTNKTNINNKSRLVMPATTAIVKRVKTKLKRKTLSSNTNPDIVVK